MREGSREQTGCFLATLMLAAAAFTLRALLRTFWVPRDATDPVLTSTHMTVVIAIVLAIIVLAFFALKLRIWALVAYAVVSAIGIIFAIVFGVDIAVPLLIGLVFVGAIAYLRRDVI